MRFQGACIDGMGGKSSGNLTQTVGQKSLTASFTVASKTYDGTTAFVDANAGSNKTVTLVGAELGGLARITAS